jgi:1-acyl-sn-glycerol-3-phosphate acyltransferase
MERKKVAKKRYTKLNLFLRSLIFLCYSTVSIVFFSFACIISRVFPLSYRHKVIRGFLRSQLYALKVICHIDYCVEGLENIPTHRNGIIFSKHQSAWETFYIPTVFHDLAIILKKELLWVPFFGWGLAASDPIGINRREKVTAMQQIICQGRRCLAAGRWILVFPEGTRVPPGVTGKYRLGGARLAAVTGYPVIPIAHNAGRYWPRRQFIKQPGTVRIVIGAVIESRGRSAEDILALAKEWIENTVAKIDSINRARESEDNSVVSRC